jgi:hypothetical protein
MVCSRCLKPERHTSYTVWSKGRLLGRTTLDFCPCLLDSRMGWFEPTEIGERVMPSLTFLGPFHEQISHEMSDRSLPGGEPLSAGRRKALAREALMYKITDEAGLALDALQVELRDEDGNVVPTTHISVQDTEYLMALGGDDDEMDPWENEVVGDDPTAPDEFSAAMIELGIEEDLVLPDDWENAGAEFPDGVDWEESSLPRYQIFVDLVDGRSVPVSDRWKDDPYVQSLVAGYDPLADESDGADDANDD